MLTQGVAACRECYWSFSLRSQCLLAWLQRVSVWETFVKKKKLQFSPLKEQIIVIYLSDKCCFYGQKKEGGETWGLCNSISVVYLQNSIISHHDFVSLITCVFRFVDQRYLRVTLDTSQSELSLFHDSFTTDNTDRCFWM